MRGFWGQHRPHGHPAACPLQHGTVRGWGVPVGRAGGLVIPSRPLFPCPVTRGWWPRRCGSWWERSATGRTRCCPPDTAQVAAGRAGCLGGLQPGASGVFLGQSWPHCCSLPPPAQPGHCGAPWGRGAGTGWVCRRGADPVLSPQTSCCGSTARARCCPSPASPQLPRLLLPLPRPPPPPSPCAPACWPSPRTCRTLPRSPRRRRAAPRPPGRTTWRGASSPRSARRRGGPATSPPRTITAA